MDWRIEDLRLFVAVVEAQSFSGAARHLGIPRPSVSRRIAALEAAAGVPLLWRTTRRMRVTQIGRSFHRHCRAILDEADAAARALTEAADRPSGTLRIAAPPDLGPRLLGPAIAAYLDRYPEVSLDVQIDERAVDLLAEGFDLGLRVGPVREEELCARPVGEVALVACCSQAMLTDRAPPDGPEALRAWPFGLFSECRNPTLWLRCGEEEVEARPMVRLFSNDFGVLVRAARSGAVAVVLPENVVAPDLDAGAMVRLLPDWSAGRSAVHLVYAPARRKLPKITAFLELLGSQGAGNATSLPI